jgi:dTDP-4-dehydrorhamnose reductase
MRAGARVLVSGAGGLLGGRLAALLAGAFDVRAGVRATGAPAGLPTVPLDLLDEAALARALDDTEPAAVVHAAALSEPDRCEREPELAWRVNAEAGGVVARLCRARGLRLVALSTDMVFDGRQGARGEDDEPAPIQVYGRTKLAGERALFLAHPDAAVVRVCLVEGRGHGARGSATEAVAWTLGRGARPRLFTDQWRTPVDPESVADLVARLLRRGGTGIFHCGGPETVTRHELGRRVAPVLGLDAGLIDAVRSADLPQAAARPRDVTLRSERARRELGWTPRALDTAIGDSRRLPAG